MFNYFPKKELAQLLHDALSTAWKPTSSSGEGGVKQPAAERQGEAAANSRRLELLRKVAVVDRILPTPYGV